MREEDYNPEKELSNGWKGYVPYAWYVEWCAWCDRVAKDCNLKLEDEE